MKMLKNKIRRMEAGFAGRALQSKAAGAGGEEDGWQRERGGWNQSVFLISNFFLVLVLQTQSASHSGHQQDRRGARAIKQYRKIHNWLQDTADRKKCFN